MEIQEFQEELIELVNGDIYVFYDICYNLIFVDTGCRKAYLMEPRNYNESIDSDVTKEIVALIKSYYPKHFKYTKWEGQGILIHKDIEITNTTDMNYLGKLLGFICDYPDTNVDRYIYKISATGLSYEYVTVITMMCAEDKTEEFYGIVDKMNDCLKDSNIEVSGSMKFIPSIDTIIETIENDGEITEDMDDEINSNFKNYSFDGLSNESRNNKIVKLMLLYFIKNDPIEAFVPVTPEQDHKFDIRMRNWVESINNLVKWKT